MLDRVRQDITYAARRLRLSPGFTLGAVAVLALGVGVNLAEFHIFNAVLFPKIFVRDVDSLRRFSHRTKGEIMGAFPYSAANFYREHNTVLSAVLTESGGTVTLDDDSAFLPTIFVSGNYFSELGAIPAYGRLLDEGDTKPGAPAVVALGHSYWQRHFGSDPGVVGRVIRLNGKPVQVVGITSYDFTGLRPSQWSVWAPVTLHPYLIKNSQLLDDFSRGSTGVYGRLRPGVSNTVAEQQLTSITAELQKQQPRYFKQGEWIQSSMLNEMPLGAKEVAAAAPFVLLILLILLSACANLGNMLLARGLTREREIEIRIAVGAGRWRVVRQLMTENLLLAVVGTIAGLLVGQLTARLLLHILDAPQGIRIETDWRILLVGAVLTFLSALVFGLTPAIQTVRRGPRVTRARQSLVAVQVAASCVLLIVASMFTKEILRVLVVDARFDYKRLIVVDPQLYDHDVKPAAARQTLDELTSRLQQLSGIDAVTVATAPPFGREARSAHAPGSPPLYVNDVSPSYFATLRIPVVRGRTFLPNDKDTVIVSESAARAMWPNEEAIGKVCDFSKRKWTVVGVVGDSGANTPATPGSVEVYTPLEDQNLRTAMLIVHTSADPAAFIAAIRSTVAVPGAPSSAWLMQTRVNQRSNNVRRAVTIIGSLGGVATLLAAIGIFSLVSFAVSQRTREIGVRMALGARNSDILWSVLSQYAAPIGIGVIAGIALAVAFFQILRSELQGFRSLDPFGYVAGVAFFALVALIAAMVPATRALRIDPSAALRSE